MTMALPVVVVCSGFPSDQHQHQQSPTALQLRRRSAKYQPTSWDYDSICSQHISRHPLLTQLLLPLPLGSGSQHQEDEEEEADDVIANHLHQPVATSNNIDITSEMEPAESVHASLMMMKNSVRRLLLLLQEEDETDSSSTNTRSRRLIRAIHQLQSLGIAYHFDQETRGALLSMHQQQRCLDLHSAALLFSMLRGLGIPASKDMLMGALREEEDVTDSDALLALYQASYLAYPGETALDQAKAFAVAKLAKAAGRRDDDDDDSDSDNCTTHTHLSPTTLPSHWTTPRLQAMWALKLIKDDDDDHNNNNNRRVAVDVDVDPAILQLAQLDFNLVQAVHRRELAEVTRWWMHDAGLMVGEGGTFFSRDRIVECFFCAACIAPEPHLAVCREVLAKISALIVHLDDIYDVYGTMDELHAFTDAIASWEREHSDSDCNDNDDLPEYMKAMYSAILTTSVTAADRVLEKHGYDVLPLYKKAWHELCKAFLVEAQWQQEGHMPSLADYVSNGRITSTGPLLLLHALPAAAIPIPITQTQANGAGIDYPRLVELSSTIFRLCNDCASHKAESERGDAPSSIACCMAAEPWCAGEEQARAAVMGVIAETWKALNWEVAVAASGSGNDDDPCCCSSSSSSSSSSAAVTTTESMTTMADLCLNLARTIHCIYQDEDGISSPTHRMKQMVKDLLFNPVTIMSSSHS